MKNTLWQKLPSVTREGKHFFTHRLASGSIVTVSQSWLSNRWTVREGERELPATWVTSGEAKRYAETVFLFGRFAVLAK